MLTWFNSLVTNIMSRQTYSTSFLKELKCHRVPCDTRQISNSFILPQYHILIFSYFLSDSICSSRAWKARNIYLIITATVICMQGVQKDYHKCHTEPRTTSVEWPKYRSWREQASLHKCWWPIHTSPVKHKHFFKMRKAYRSYQQSLKDY